MPQFLAALLLTMVAACTPTTDLPGPRSAPDPPPSPTHGAVERPPGFEPLQRWLEDRREMHQRRSAYLARYGRAEWVPELLELARGADAGAGAQPEAREVILEGLALDLATLGFSPQRVRVLRGRGIDVILAADTRPDASLEARAILSDLVVVGQVQEFTSNAGPEDGFHSSLVVRVEEVLKGEAAPAEVVIRQQSGQTPDGREHFASGDLRARLGDRYLLFLSHQLYRWQVESTGRRIPDAGAERFFVIGRGAYHVGPDRLRQVPHGYYDETADLERARARVRIVAERMRGL
jgi:hypothetical protein